MSQALSISSNVSLAAVDLGLSALSYGTKFTLISYGVAGDPGMFGGMPDDSLITIDSRQFVINYNDTPTGSVNGGSFANAVTLTLTAVPEANAFLCVGASASSRSPSSASEKRRSRQRRELVAAGYRIPLTRAVPPYAINPVVLY